MPHIVHIVRTPTDDYTLPSASRRPRHSKITKSDASHLGNKLPSTTPSNDAISLPSTCARRILETSSYASSRLALHAQSSLPQRSREFRNVITPRQKISYVITRQDGCHKLTFLRKDDQYFVMLNDRPWQ